MKIRTGKVFIVKGIYAYSDTKYDSYCYVGKDSHIDEGRRDYRHNQPYYYDEQPINRILQNNRERYDYVKLVELSDDFTDDDLNDLESVFIDELDTYHYDNPRGFNFTKGGDGRCGYEMSNESKKKISLKNKGKIRSDVTKQKLRDINLIKEAHILKAGFMNGKQMYELRKDGKRLKRSINVSKLLEEAEFLNKNNN